MPYKRFDPYLLEPVPYAERRIKKALSDRHLRVFRRKGSGDLELWRISPRNGAKVLVADWGPDEEVFTNLIVYHTQDTWNLTRTEHRLVYERKDEALRYARIKARMELFRDSIRENLARRARDLAWNQGSINIPKKLRPKPVEHEDGLGLGSSTYWG